MASGLVTEIVMTFMFLFVILGATDARAPKGFAPIAIGLCLTLIHLISIPVTNTSVNPARSTGPAIFVGDDRSSGPSWPERFTAGWAATVRVNRSIYLGKGREDSWISLFFC